MPFGIQLPGCSAGWWNGAARSPLRESWSLWIRWVRCASAGTKHWKEAWRPTAAGQASVPRPGEGFRRDAWSAASGRRRGSGAAQGVKHISVQSSVSLQHLPYNKELEQELPAEIVGRLAFAKQKLAEVVAAAKSAEGVKPVGLTSALPTVGAPPPPRMPPPRGRAGPLQL